MKGIGIEKRRCDNCQNLQDVIALDDAITVFFRCDKCNSEIFIDDKHSGDYHMRHGMLIDST